METKRNDNVDSTRTPSPPPASSTSTSTTLPSEFLSGATFGTALLLSGVYVPEIIQAQLLLTNTHMLQVFLGGSAASALVLDLAHRCSIYPKTARPPASMGVFAYDGNLLGGALIGLGMASTGACPGTSLVQLGAGMGNGGLVVLGGVMGAALFLKLKPILLNRQRVGESSSPALEPPASPNESAMETLAIVPDSPAAFIPQKTSLDIPTAFSIQPLTVLLLWIPMCVSIIALARFLIQPPSTFPSAGIIAPPYGGLLIGVAQAATVLLTKHHIGASSAYEDLARWLGDKVVLQGKGGSSSTLITPSLTFSAGIIWAVAILKNSILGARLASATPPPMSTPLILRTVAGGASMVFGARLAGGCTSGHGISGLSKFSLSSLVTTCAMFAGGMLSAQVMGAR